MIGFPSVEVVATRLRSGRFRLNVQITIGPELARTLSAGLLMLGAKLASDETPGPQTIEIRPFDAGWLVVVPRCLAEPQGARRRFPTIEAAREFASYRGTWLRLPVREVAP
jgi:hypothetical protein